MQNKALKHLCETIECFKQIPGVSHVRVSMLEKVQPNKNSVDTKAYAQIILPQKVHANIRYSAKLLGGHCVGDGNVEALSCGGNDLLLT